MFFQKNTIDIMGNKKLLIINSWHVFEFSEITEDISEKIKPVIEEIKNFKPYFIYNEDGTKNYVGNNYPSKKHNEKYPFTKSIEEMYGHLEGFETFKALIKNHFFDDIDKVQILDIENEENIFGN